MEGVFAGRGLGCCNFVVRFTGVRGESEGMRPHNCVFNICGDVVGANFYKETASKVDCQPIVGVSFRLQAVQLRSRFKLRSAKCRRESRAPSSKFIQQEAPMDPDQ